jgi:hypothetical protein
MRRAGVWSQKPACATILAERWLASRRRREVSTVTDVEALRRPPVPDLGAGTPGLGQRMGGLGAVATRCYHRDGNVE